MAEVSVEEAAYLLGVSTDTVRRRIRRDQLSVRREPDGRLLVTIPDRPGQAPAGAEQPPAPAQQTPVAASLPLLERLLDEKDARIGALEEEIASLRGELAKAHQEMEAQRQDRATAEGELRQLLLQAQLQVQALIPKLPAPAEVEERKAWWRWW